MPVEISLKKSTFNPTSTSGLTLAEPVFNSSNNTLWIGKGSGQTPIWVGAGICGAFGAIAAGLTYILPTAFSVQQYIQSVGVTGAAGATGPQGAQGNTGPTGPVGDYVISFNGLTGAVTGVTTSVANTFTAIQRFNSGISASGATFNGPISGPTGSVTFGKIDLADSGAPSKNFTVPVTLHKTYLDNPSTEFEAGGNTENKVPLTISYTTDPLLPAPDVLIGLYDATGATYSTRIKTTGIQTGGTVTATSFSGTLNGSVNAINGNKITTAVFDTPETSDVNPPPVFTFNAATNTDADLDGLLDEIPVLRMGFAGATFSTNVYAPNLVNSVNGITGSVNLIAGTGITLSQSGKNLTITNTQAAGSVDKAFVIAMSIAL